MDDLVPSSPAAFVVSRTIIFLIVPDRVDFCLQHRLYSVFHIYPNILSEPESVRGR